MGTCTIRDKNFLYREAVEAICLLQCRWGSLDEAPVQGRPFCKGRRALLSLWDPPQKWLFSLLPLITLMAFHCPLTFDSEASPVHFRLFSQESCFGTVFLPAPTLAGSLLSHFFHTWGSELWPKRIGSLIERDHVTGMATLHLLESSSRRLRSGLSKMLKKVRNSNLMLCAAPYVLTGLGGLSGSWINFTFKAWDQKSNRCIIFFSWSHIYADQENKVNVHWRNSHFEFSVF